MDRDSCINAILTPPQLERFCDVFDIEPSSIEVNLEGWEKHVLIAGDRVFMFPRSPEHVRTLKKELAVYEGFSRVESSVLPRLIDRVQDRSISFYEFGVVTRLHGIPFGGIEAGIGISQLTEFLGGLAREIAELHQIPLAEMPSFVARIGSALTGGHVTSRNWHRRALSAGTVENAVDFIRRIIARYAAFHGLDAVEIASDDTGIKWGRVLTELAGMARVLVHTDLHENQILVESEERQTITGILDWGRSRIDNPLWDFNFGEWGYGLWEWRDQFAALRRQMWGEYLKSRGIKLFTLDGLHLFFTLYELVRLITESKVTGMGFFGSTFEESLSEYFRKLAEVTKSL